MSTQPISSGTSTTASNQYASGSSLTSLGNGSLQITGLASGLNTNTVVQALMAAQQQQVTRLQNQQSRITALDKQLTSIQTALQTVVADAKALGSPSLFANTQRIISTNLTLVGATANGSNGAVVGSYSIAVTKLASASQRTFSFQSPTTATSVAIDGHTTHVAANASAQDFVNAVNSDSNAKVWATVTGTDPNSRLPQIVVSERTSGAPPAAGYVVINSGDDPSGVLSDAGYGAAGSDAEYTINGGPTQYSSSNTISGVSLGGNTPPPQDTGATQTIPGVTVSLNGLTGSIPVAISVGAPAANTQNIQTAVQKFVSDYNSAISQIQTQLGQPPNPSDPTQGTLYGDPGLHQLLGSMRQMMVSTVGGLVGMKSMLDAGVSTGAAGAVSQSSLSGNLTLDTNTLISALASNASAVKSMFQSWSIQFSSLVNREAGAGRTITTRMQSDASHSSYLTTQIQNLNETNQLKQAQLVREFARMEAALSQNQSTSTWLTNQLNALPHS
jgi:flagellar hook-associated protein 2